MRAGEDMTEGNQMIPINLYSIVYM
jgi:hypothetical protein